jgi:hypothetical protein
MSLRKLLAGGVIAGCAVVGLAAPSSADHVHSKQVGNGSCVLLARNGGERYVQLPHHSTVQANRRHPLHVNVHLGRPGQNFAIGVFGTTSDPCYPGGDYLND